MPKIDTDFPLRPTTRAARRVFWAIIFALVLLAAVLSAWPK
jgi:hypothetical protein